MLLNCCVLIDKRSCVKCVRPRKLCLTLRRQMSIKENAELLISFTLRCTKLLSSKCLNERCRVTSARRLPCDWLCQCSYAPNFGSLSNSVIEEAF